MKKKAQIIGISVAGVAGLLAFLVMGSMLKPPPKPVEVDKIVDAVKVLVAKSDIELGTRDLKNFDSQARNTGTGIKPYILA